MRLTLQVGVPLTLLLGAAVVSLQGEVLYLPMNGLELAHEKTSRIDCVNHLKQILWAAQVWSMDHVDQPPPDLQTLTNNLQSPAALFCPANLLIAVPTNWTQLDWNHIDYEWLPLTNWANPTNMVVRCRIHNSTGLVQGSVLAGGYRPGWPAIMYGPVEARATPNADIYLKVRVAADALQPLNYQWRREHLSYATNVVRVTNPDDPNGVYWQTNVIPSFAVTNLPTQTNSVLFLSHVQTNDSDFYSVAVTNPMGVSVSRQTRLRVDPALAGITTNAYWAELYCLNNLKMIGLIRSIWAADHNDRFPQNFEVMTNPDGSPMFGWPATLYCLSDTNRVAPEDWSKVDFTNTSYELVPGDAENPHAPFCRCRVHNFYVQMDGETIKQPRFHDITRLSSPSFELSFRVFADKTNLLETSSDFVNWTALTSYSSTNGDFRYVDAAPSSRRFYRLRLP